MKDMLDLLKGLQAFIEDLEKERENNCNSKKCCECETNNMQYDEATTTVTSDYNDSKVSDNKLDDLINEFIDNTKIEDICSLTEMLKAYSLFILNK